MAGEIKRLWVESGAWHGPANLPGTAKQITAQENRDQRHEVFYIGADDRIYHNSEIAPGLAWRGESLLCNRTARHIASWYNYAQGRLELFFVGLDDNVIYRIHQITPAGPEYTAASPVAGSHALQVTVCQHDDRRFELLYFGPDHAMHHQTETAIGSDAFGPPAAFPGESAQQIVVAMDRTGCLEMFYIGLGAGRIFHKKQSTRNGSWGGTERLDGEAAAKFLAVGRNGDNRIDVFYCGSNNHLYHNWELPGGGWHGEDRLSGASALQVAPAMILGSNRQEVIYVGTNYHLYGNEQKAANGTDWYGEQTLSSDKVGQVAVAQNYFRAPSRNLDVLYIHHDDAAVTTGFDVINMGARWSENATTGSTTFDFYPGSLMRPGCVITRVVNMSEIPLVTLVDGSAALHFESTSRQWTTLDTIAARGGIVEHFPGDMPAWGVWTAHSTHSSMKNGIVHTVQLRVEWKKVQ